MEETYVHFRGMNKAPLLSKEPLAYSLPYIDDAHGPQDTGDMLDVSTEGLTEPDELQWSM